MKNKQQDDDYKKFVTQFGIATSSTEGILGFIGISFVLSILFGPFAYLIVASLFSGWIFLSLTFSSPYQLFKKIIPLRDMPYFVKPTLVQVLSNLGLLIIAFGLILMGIRWFYTNEFCEQSLLCIFIKYS